MKTLVVDDNPSDRKILRCYLEQRGCEIAEAPDGEEGLKTAGRDIPDLIISDALMPKMDGFQFLRKIKSDPRLQTIPFIFYSSVYTGARDEQLALSLGADAFIVKPKEPEELWGEISAALEKRKSVPGKIEPELMEEEEEEYLKQYTLIVTEKIEEKIRELEKANAEIQLRGNSYRNFFNSIRDVIIATDDNRNILDANQPALREIFGYELDEVVGKNALLIYADEESYTAAGRKIIARREPTRGRIMELNFRRKNGETFSGELCALKRIDEEGVPSGYIGMIRDISKRKKAEEELLESRERLRNLSAHLQAVREEERTAIAREIHDELGQILATLQLDASLVADGLREEQTLLAAKVEAMVQLIGSSIKTVQRISAELRPVMLDDLGLTAAMEWQAKEFEKRSGIPCEIAIFLKEEAISREVATAVFRIFQEALTNVLRHANATRIEASLTEKRGRLELVVRDDGRGITREQADNPLSLGLVGMRERVVMVGGKISICGFRGKGTVVVVRIPVAPKEGAWPP